MLILKNLSELKITLAAKKNKTKVNILRKEERVQIFIFISFYNTLSGSEKVIIQQVEFVIHSF